jgi:predicted AlkP superfamily pyrophosphatase or phosphodiesterase
MHIRRLLRPFPTVAMICLALAAHAGDRKVVLVSWDAAADWVVDRLLAEGRLPAVARMAREGVQAEHMLAAFPSQTAVGHAAIFNGCWGDCNGVTSNQVSILPPQRHRLDETSSGFASSALLTEPLFVGAALAGKKVVALSATQLDPTGRHVATLQDAGVGLDRLVAFSGFEHQIAPARLLGSEVLQSTQPGWNRLPRHQRKTRELTFEVGGVSFFALLFDDPADPTRGFDTVLIRQGSRSRTCAAQAILKPATQEPASRAWGGPFWITGREIEGPVYFRLFSLATNGSEIELYQRSVHGLRGTENQRETRLYLEAYGGFHDDAFGAYQRGMLGSPMWEGGDGEAERRMLEIVRLDCEFSARGTRYALAHWKPDLLLHYTPLPDSAGHVWMGVLDPASPTHDAALASRLWPYYAEVLTHADAWLGDVLEAVDSETAVVLVSDHGMEGTGHLFHPNTVLARAGLLRRTRTGEVDLAHTLVLAPPGGGFFLTVNDAHRAGGAVAAADRAGTLEHARQAMLAATDPRTGQPIVTAVFAAANLPGMGIGGPTGGDLYIDLARGIYPTSTLSEHVIEAVPSPIGMGSHGFFPHRRSMHAIFYLWGAGVARGVRIGPMTQVDVYPTVARLLGIAIPSHVTGHVLGETLAP